MGVLSLHNECPPLGYGPDTQAICQGLILGEESTSALLKSLADCLSALAAMDDTVGRIVAAFAQASAPSQSGGGESAEDSFANVFAALDRALPRVGLAIRKCREWLTYARAAAEAGRGHDFQAALKHAADGDEFSTLVALRIEGLRKLQVRIQVLQRFKETGLQMLRSYDYPGFFVLLMSPVRDLAVVVNELYGEVLRGALASHRAYCRVGEMMGEDSEAGGGWPMEETKGAAPARVVLAQGHADERKRVSSGER